MRRKTMRNGSKFWVKILAFSLMLFFGFVDALLSDVETVDLSSEADKSFYMELTNKALAKLNADNSDPQHWKLDKFIKGKKQLTAGMLYKLKFSVVRSECRKDVSGFFEIRNFKKNVFLNLRKFLMTAII